MELGQFCNLLDNMIEIVKFFIGQPSLELFLLESSAFFSEKLDEFFELCLGLDLHEDACLGIIEAEFCFIH